MPTVADAESLAAAAHADQVDKGGKPYVQHLARVAALARRRAAQAQAQGLPVRPDEVAQAAWLHEIVEDTPTTSADLLAQGFAENVVAIIELLTKRKGAASYAEKIAPIIESGNLGAILIKLSDNEDNNDPNRPCPPDFEHLTARYAASMEALRKAASALGYTESTNA